MTTNIHTLPLPLLPFKGIEAFQLSDHPIFFARKHETNRLLRLVTIYRGVLLYGKSGIGKSSLINAGLIPALLEHNFNCEKIRVQPLINEEIIVKRILIDSEKENRYSPSLFESSETAQDILITLSINDFRSKVNTLSKDKPLVLVFDQFEELITLFEEDPRGEELKKALELQREILNLLVDLLKDQNIPVKILFAFREDYLPKLEKLFRNAPNLTDQFLRLNPLSLVSIKRIIRGPFEEPDLKGHFKNEISEKLAEKLTKEVKTQSEEGTLKLSEIQIACLKLWKSKDPESLFQKNGFKGLLEEYFADALQEISKDSQKVAISTFGFMITSAGLRKVIDRDTLIKNVAKDIDIRREVVEIALQELEEKSKLIRREIRRNVTYYEIVSEFLVPWISQQKGLRHTENERRKITQKEKIKTRKIIWWSTFFVAIAVSITSVVFYYDYQSIIQKESVKKANRAEENAKVKEVAALKAKDEAVTEKINALMAKVIAEKGKANAIEAQQKAEKEKKAALKAKDKAEAERVAALKAKEMAEKGKANAIEAQQKAEKEKKAALKAKEEAEAKELSALKAKEIAEKEKASAIKAQQIAEKEKKAALKAKEEAKAEEITALNVKIDEMEKTIVIKVQQIVEDERKAALKAKELAEKEKANAIEAQQKAEE